MKFATVFSGFLLLITHTTDGKLRNLTRCIDTEPSCNRNEDPAVYYNSFTSVKKCENDRSDGVFDEEDPTAWDNCIWDNLKVDTNNVGRDHMTWENQHGDNNTGIQPPSSEDLNFDRDDDDNHIMKCAGHYHSSYWDHWLGSIHDDSCARINGADHCMYDFTEDLSIGAFDHSKARCASKGGDLYIFDGVITCVDGSSYTFVNDILDCYSSCDVASVEYAVKFDLTADLFLQNLGLSEKEGCSWSTMIAYDIEDVANYGDDDDDSYDLMSGLEDITPDGYYLGPVTDGTKF